MYPMNYALRIRDIARMAVGMSGKKPTPWRPDFDLVRRSVVLGEKPDQI
jgi:hypothetical protein